MLLNVPPEEDVAASVGTGYGHVLTLVKVSLDIFQSLDHLTAFFGVGAFDAEAQNFALRKVVRKQLGFCDRHVVYRTPLVGLLEPFVDAVFTKAMSTCRLQWIPQNKETNWTVVLFVSDDEIKVISLLPTGKSLSGSKASGTDGR